MKATDLKLAASLGPLRTGAPNPETQPPAGPSTAPLTKEALVAQSTAGAELAAKLEKKNLVARSAVQDPALGGTQGKDRIAFEVALKSSGTPPESAPASKTGSDRLPARVESGPYQTHLVPPDRATLARARVHLATLGPTDQLSTKEARALVEDAVHAARQVLIETTRASKKHSDLPLGQIFSPEHLAGRCGYGQALTATRLGELGIAQDKLHVIQAASVFGPDSFRHAFIVASMPDGKAYLIDTTFGQFFNQQHTGRDQIGHPGALMTADKAGARVAKEILERGYVELTDESARAYGNALGQNSARAPITAKQLLRSTEGLDYDRQELDLLPPPPPLPTRKTSSGAEAAAPAGGKAPPKGGAAPPNAADGGAS